ncbi:MAG TPA: hypothetical protein VJ227_02140 [Patescibacteria group bacterium]|nr:hypothetical protein [Patescibacteria group bacterium]
MDKERMGKPTPGIYIFVGENRSPKAKDNGLSWTGCQITGIPRLAMKPLWEAFEKAGIDPRIQIFFNLWNDDGSPSEMNRGIIKEMAGDGEIVVGMGRKVQAELQKLGIAHREMFHPAARGRIRATKLFRQHVKRVLS